MEKVEYQAVGRRKESVAQVRLVPGEGKIVVNDKPLNEYFPRKISESTIREPLELTDTLDKFDVFAKVKGGGLSGQAGALKHGISRALLKTDASLKSILRKGHLLTRDPRMKERKKYGQKGARARFQYSKR
jgi:small subunit ribosomal protein S9